MAAIPKKCAPLPSSDYKKSLKFSTSYKAAEKPAKEKAVKKPLARSKPIKAMSDTKKLRIATEGSENDLFTKVWNSRPHRCEECDKELFEARRHNFDHVV